MTKHTRSPLSSDTSVAAARKAYRDLLARNGLTDFSQREIADARTELQSRGDQRPGRRDVRFQAAANRLRSRADLTADRASEILRELAHSEVDLDQAEWERDCYRRVWLSHSAFRVPRHPEGAEPATVRKPPR